MPPIPTAAENFFHLITQGPPATLMSTLRRAKKHEGPDIDEQRERQLSLSPDEDRKCEVDPFSNYVKMEVVDWIQVAIGSIVFLPIRVLGVILTFVLAWIVAKVGITGLPDDQLNPLTSGRTGWRRKLMVLFAFFGRLMFFVAGFRVDIKGKQASRREAPILVGAPHSSFLEGCIMIMCGGSPVSRHENRNAIIISTIQNFYQSIFVDRRTTKTRQKAKDDISARVRSPDENLPQLFICPEGTNTNRKVLIQFKTGAFVPGVPVQPVIIRYPGYDRVDAITWTFRQKHTYLFSLWYLLSKPVNRLEITFLPVYRPSEDEKLNPTLFARNVQNEMAKTLGLPATDISYSRYYNEYCAQHNALIPDVDKCS